MLVIFLKGSAEEKMKLMFDMYDINNTGRLKREEFSNMLRLYICNVIVNHLTAQYFSVHLLYMCYNIH